MGLDGRGSRTYGIPKRWKNSRLFYMAMDRTSGGEWESDEKYLDKSWMSSKYISSFPVFLLIKDGVRHSVCTLMLMIPMLSPLVAGGGKD